MRDFNASGPNFPDKHYTIQRTQLIQKGIQLVQKERYFTIWAPRQTGKSTYFGQLAEHLKTMGYKPAITSVEDFERASISSIMNYFNRVLSEKWDVDFQFTNINDLFEQITNIKDGKFVWIIDEIENYNPTLIHELLHSIRKIYHSRQEHCLKSVILVGVSNILGIIQDNASPFNIADNLDVPYFTTDETFALLKQHEDQTGQLFELKVKQKLSEITANQPGLVNGFAYRLVDTNIGKEIIDYTDYLKVEDWYLTEAIDKNFSNILNKSNEYRDFAERLLYTDAEIPFRIERPAIKLLYANGLIRKSKDGNVEFWVPYYKKKLYDAFYPYTNGEKKYIGRELDTDEYYLPNGQLNIDKLITNYRDYVKRRGFGVFREKNEKGNFISIPEAALVYSFETYIQAFVQEAEGKTYREANTGLGRSDLIINIKNTELLIETKVYYSPKQFAKGKGQVAYYCKSLGIKTGIYLVFVPNDIVLSKPVLDNKEIINDVEIITYIISYDEEKDFTYTEPVK